MKFSWQNIKSKLLNKYFIVFFAFIAYIAFFDESNLISRIQSRKKIAELDEEIEHYEKKIAEDQEKIEALNASLENLETFARENYLMHRHNEEIFIIDE